MGIISSCCDKKKYNDIEQPQQSPEQRSPTTQQPDRVGF